MPSFDLTAEPIAIEAGVWVAARANIGPGVTLGSHSVVGLGATVTSDLPPSEILSSGGDLNFQKRIIGSYQR